MNDGFDESAAILQSIRDAEALAISVTRRDQATRSELSTRHPNSTIALPNQRGGDSLVHDVAQRMHLTNASGIKMEEMLQRRQLIADVNLFLKEINGSLR